MKKSFFLTFFAALGLLACSQPPRKKAVVEPVSQNTLLWRISGKDLKQPSYLFGTMHMICASDIVLSDSLRSAIRASEHVYLELDLDDMMQMFSAMGKMKMRNDTTLRDLLTAEEYHQVKAYFDTKGGLIPFAMMEKFKPMLIESMIIEQSGKCENMIVMEQLVMEEAKRNRKDIKGLETMDFQISIFDSIPYGLQAKQLLKMVQAPDTTKGPDEMAILTNAYRNQELKKMEELTTESDPTISQFTELLLYKRNENWVEKLKTLMANNGILIAVGAGHLPGDRGVINLLKKAGYTVEPVRNDMIRKPKEGKS